MINSRQAIQEYSDAQEAIKFSNDRGLESYMCLLEDMRSVITSLNEVIEAQQTLIDYQAASSVQFGEVAPDTNITSNNSQLYFNTLTSTMYTNPNKGVVTGWVAI